MGIVRFFTPLDFPDLDQLEYRHIRPLLWESGYPLPPALFADILRSTLPFWKRRKFDRLSGVEVLSLVENYVEMNVTKEQVLDELRNKRNTRGFPEKSD
jgi:hypothetical protein